MNRRNLISNFFTGLIFGKVADKNKIENDFNSDEFFIKIKDKIKQISEKELEEVIQKAFHKVENERRSELAQKNL